MCFLVSSLDTVIEIWYCRNKPDRLKTKHPRSWQVLTRPQNAMHPLRHRVTRHHGHHSDPYRLLSCYHLLRQCSARLVGTCGRGFGRCAWRDNASTESSLSVALFSLSLVFLSCLSIWPCLSGSTYLVHVRSLILKCVLSLSLFPTLPLIFLPYLSRSVWMSRGRECNNKVQEQWRKLSDTEERASEREKERQRARMSKALVTLMWV